jgi:hypothetical protein
MGQTADNPFDIDWSQPAEAIGWDVAVGWQLVMGRSVPEARDCIIDENLREGKLRPLGHFMRRYGHVPGCDVCCYLTRMSQPQAFSSEEVPYALTLKDRTQGKGRPRKDDQSAIDILMATFCKIFAKGDFGAPETKSMMANMFDPAPGQRAFFVTVSRRGTRGKVPDTAVLWIGWQIRGRNPESRWWD